MQYCIQIYIFAYKMISVSNEKWVISLQLKCKSFSETTLIYIYIYLHWFSGTSAVKMYFHLFILSSTYCKWFSILNHSEKVFINHTNNHTLFLSEKCRMHNIKLTVTSSSYSECILFIQFSIYSYTFPHCCCCLNGDYGGRGLRNYKRYCLWQK